MPFLALFTSKKDSSVSSPKATKSRRDRRSCTGPPPSIAPRESSLYSSNFAAAASVSCLPLYGVESRNQSSIALSAPRPLTDYGTLGRRNFSCIEISKVPEHSPSYSVTFADQDYTPRFAIPTEDFALGAKVTLTRRSPLRTKKWASQSVIGLVKRRMSGNQSRDDLRYAGDEWPQDSEYPEEQDDMVPPPLPSRSSLRAPTSSSPVYYLPVDPPTTPSLSSSSSDDGENQASPDIRTPATSSDHSWGRKKRQDSRDPLKVRDGAPTKESRCGVYTPTTFPGAHGPRPSHFPTHVYTPTEYAGPAGPSRSSSMSSSASGSNRSSPRTPTSPISPRWSSMSLSSSFRRLSTTFASLDPRQTAWHSPRSGEAEPSFPFQPPAPDYTRINAGLAVIDPRNTTWDPPSPASPRKVQSAKESYFPSISAPDNFTRLGGFSASSSALGLETPPSPSPPAHRSRYSVSEVKRKPVPKVDDIQTEIEKLDIDRDDNRTPTAATAN